jgi:nicotinate-nucleotide pyrophosphorylase
MEDIPKLREKDVDIIDIGRAILDAPMLDISFDVQFSG